jgi:hypothetical protein
MAMALLGLLVAWNYWTDFSEPQDFMERGRAHGHTTIDAAVDAYVVEITGVHCKWVALDAEELEEIGDVLMSSLFAEQGASHLRGNQGKNGDTTRRRYTA